MDFPVCPSCGQSVLDDDAEDCPFCGSSMKAKPGSKPSAAKPAAAASPKGAAPSSPKLAAAPPKSNAGMAARPGGGKPGPADDFPFEAEVPGARTAIQAMPNPSKGRSHQVVCPMCETAGYVPPTAVGKDVKCANAKCMVPIFKAPAAVVEAPPPPPPKKSNVMMVGIITAVVVAGIGAALVFLPSMGGGAKPVNPGGLSDEAKELIAESMKTKPGVEKPVQPVKPVETTLPDDNGRGDAIPKTPDEFVAAALKQLNDSCLKGDSRQRSKPLCRQLAADACVRAGDTKAASEHLAQLIVVGPRVPYYRIEPGLEMFWNAWSAGDKGIAAKIVNSALVDSEKLLQVGRNQMEVASRLAAALAVSGRLQEGLDLLKNHQTAKLEGQLSARVQMATDGRVGRLTISRSVLPWTSPQAVATTASLIARNQPAAARSWAEAQTDEEARAECLSVWAEGVAFQQAKPGAATASPEIADAVKGSTPALAARVWARAACGRFIAGDKDGAAATVKVASDLLASVPVPAEPDMPEIKAGVNYKLPAVAPLVQAATTAAEISFVHSLWPDHSADADKSLELALSFARGLAPGLPAVFAKQKEADQAGQAGLVTRIKKELGIKNDDVATQNVQKYRKVLVDLKTGATRRLDLQVDILSRLAEVGSKSTVWSVVSNRSAETNANRRDEFLNTRLVSELVVAFRGTETEKIILGAVGGTLLSQPDIAVVKELLPQSPQQAAQFVNGLEADSAHRDDVALRIATYLAATDKVGPTLEFIAGLKDIVLREEAYRLAAALLAQRGHADAVWKQMTAVSQATEKASLCRGLVVGLKAGPPQKELPEHVLVP